VHTFFREVNLKAFLSQSMPGANCSIFGCSTSRKNKGISIFCVPTGDDAYNTRWREKLFNIITKDRVIDKSLKSQIERRSLYTCELHYNEECLIRNQTKTTRIPGSLPTLNLPIKSYSKVSVNERSKSSIEKRESAVLNTQNSVSKQECYKSLADFIQRTQKLKLPIGWEVKNNNNLSIFKQDYQHAVPKLEILVDNELNYEILLYNWLIPNQMSYIQSIICHFKM
jgi:hypothetical protein